MSRKLLVDLITEDSANDEFVLYLVEEGPWPAGEVQYRLRGIQERIYDAVDAAIDGFVARKYPASKGRKFRVQVDCHDDPPAQVERLVSGLNQLIATSPDYRKDIDSKGFVAEIRIVSRKQMERGDAD